MLQIISLFNSDGILFKKNNEDIEDWVRTVFTESEEENKLFMKVVYQVEYNWRQVNQINHLSSGYDSN